MIRATIRPTRRANGDRSGGISAPQLVAAFREQIGGGNPRLVGNLAGVDYTSSAGLRALLETVKDARQHGGDLRVEAAVSAHAAGVDRSDDITMLAARRLT